MKAAHVLLFAVLLAGPALAEGLPVGVPPADLGEAGIPGTAGSGVTGVDTIADPELDMGVTGIDAVPDPVNGRIDAGEAFDGTIYPGDAIPGEPDDGDLADGDQPTVVEADGPVVIVPEREYDDPANDENGAATLDEGVEGAVEPEFIQVD